MSRKCSSKARSIFLKSFAVILFLKNCKFLQHWEQLLGVRDQVRVAQMNEKLKVLMSELLDEGEIR